MGKSPHITFVLIMCKPNSILDIAWQLEEIENVKEATLVAGSWQIIVKFEAQDTDHIIEAIESKLRKITGIESTLTLVVKMT